jgi:hypothetical protein
VWPYVGDKPFVQCGGITTPSTEILVGKKAVAPEVFKKTSVIESPIATMLDRGVIESPRMLKENDETAGSG